MIDPTDQKEFDWLVSIIAKSEESDLKYWVGRALCIETIEEIAAQYKDGWLGDHGRFARVVARCLSQLN